MRVLTTLICTVATATTLAAPPGNPLFPLTDPATGKRGFVNAKMEWVIPPTYDGAEPFDGELATVGIGKYPDEKWGCVDRAGKVVIPIKYEGRVEFGDGLAAVRPAGAKDAPYGFIDRTGKAVLPAKYRFARKFNFRLACVTEGNWSGYIDPAGNRKITLGVGEVGEQFDDGGLARVLCGPGTYRFIDPAGKEWFRSAQNPWKFNNERCRVSAREGGRGGKEKYGFIDRTGKIAIAMKFDHAYNFNNGLAPVQVDGMWGYVDVAGNAVTPVHFGSVREFARGRGVVDFEGLTGTIDPTGKWVARPVFAAIDHIDPDGWMLARRWVRPGVNRPMVVHESYVHDSNPRKIEVPRDLIQLLAADEPGLPRTFAKVSQLTEKQKADTQAAFEQINKEQYTLGILALTKLHDERVAPASVVLGRIYQTGLGVPKDAKKALQFYTAAALGSSDPYALYQIAQLNRGTAAPAVPADFGRMTMCAQMAADAGHGPSLRLLAALMLDGTMMDVNPDVAMEYIVKAVRAGDGRAKLAAAICMELGLGTIKDEKAALSAYQLSGLPDGHYRAGKLLEAQGNADEAQKWYQRAAKGGHERAKSRVTPSHPIPRVP
ncbi:MAG TPA: SEL1-like repeat protein [Tepidisphaeraceae bacterium]|nr:SEL1-like repeat protein [Tepidisphaeraceae bacterium]